MKRLLVMQVTLIILGLSISASMGYIIASSNYQPKLDDDASQITELKSQITSLKNETASLNQTIDQQSKMYLSLFNTSYGASVSRLQAVQIALRSGGWNNTNLGGLEVDTSLIYCRFWYANNGDEKSFEILQYVKAPVSDYFPRAEYNVTDPGAVGGFKGTMWYRYVWLVTVEESGGLQSVPPPGYYYVDASTGEVIPHFGADA